MNKVTKAAVAAGAAAALMLGGAGTFALWSADNNVDAGTVTTGHLTMAVGTGVWEDVSVPAVPVPFNATTETIVPGDTVTYTQTVTIDAEGKNLKGALTVGTVGAVPLELEGQVTVALDVDDVAAGLTNADGVLSFDAPGEYVVPVKITVAFAAGTEASTFDTTMGQAIDLTALTLTLNQTR